MIEPIVCVTQIAPSTLKGLLRIASKDPVRKYLNGIYFDPAGYAVATDGSALVAVRVPAFDGDGFTVPRESCGRAIKARPSRHCDMPVARERIGWDVMYAPLEGRYPDWRRVVPSKCAQFTKEGEPTTIAVELMGHVHAALCDIQTDKLIGRAVAMSTTGGACLVKTRADVLAIVMPCRIGIFAADEAATHVAQFLAPVPAPVAVVSADVA